MEKTLLLLFLILFLGRIIWRFILQQLNIRHLRNHGKEIPPVFHGIIDETTLAKMVNYTYDNSRLETKENLAEDILELAILFLVLPVLVAKLAGLPLHIIWQALIFFGVLSAVPPESPSIFTTLLFWKRNTVFPQLHGNSG
jgi:STE24 endopeptidase